MSPTGNVCSELRRVADLIERCGAPKETAERLLAALAVAELGFHVRVARALIDPARERSYWSVAGELAESLNRFEQEAWPNIRNGRRKPRNVCEQVFARMLAVPRCPRSRRRLVDYL